MTDLADDLKTIREALKHARNVGLSMYRGGGQELYDEAKAALEALERVREGIRIVDFALLYRDETKHRGTFRGAIVASFRQNLFAALNELEEKLCETGESP